MITEGSASIFPLFHPTPEWYFMASYSITSNCVWLLGAGDWIYKASWEDMPSDFPAAFSHISAEEGRLLSIPLNEEKDENILLCLLN